MNFLEQIDNVFLISKAMIEDKGEDNYYCSVCPYSAIISVFDGCGGLGSKIYNSLGGYKGSYIASRLVSGAVHDWFHHNCKRTWNDEQEIVSTIDEYIRNAYAICKKYAIDNSKISGSMVRDFPTTAAIAFLEPDFDGICVHVMWAGDSRVYLLDCDGLAQISKDDVANTDALENLKSDGAMNNVLSADGRYRINYTRIHVNRPTSLFVATDGCFGYLSSPMEFEYMIIGNIMEAQTPEMLEKKLYSNITEYAGDDFALGMIHLLYGNYENLHQDLYYRMQILEEEYIRPLYYNHSDEMIERLWKEYRKNYERYM